MKQGQNAAAIIIAIVSCILGYLMFGGYSSRDTTNYSALPPWPVFKAVVWLSSTLRWAADSLTPPAIRVVDLAFEVNHIMSIYACTKAGWPELLHQGKRTAAEMATHANISKGKATRLLRACVAWNMFRETTSSHAVIEDYDREYVNTPLADNLREDHPYSTKAFLGHLVEDTFPASLRLWDGVRDDAVVPFAQVHKYPHHGSSVWNYFKDFPAQEAQFNRAMTSMDAISVATLTNDFNWAEKCTTIVDVGGGRGSVLAAVLQAAPNANGILFDLDTVIAQSQILWGEKYQDRMNRVKFVAGSFFNPSDIPKSTGQGYCYIAKAVLHDWDDQSVGKVLRNLVGAMKSGNRFLILETPPHQPETMPARTMFDMQMLLISGRERTVAEFQPLLRQAGLRLAAAHPTRSIFTIMEAVAE